MLPPGLDGSGQETRAALLLPLSGKQGALGQAMSNAAQMALFDAGTSHFNLLPLDTQGTPEGASAAAKQALAGNADIIIGPLTSGEVKAVSSVVSSTGPSVLAFTTDRSVLGHGVYTLGFLPSSQVSRVVGYARTQGKKSFALLAPSSDYGRAIADSFRTAVPAQGGQVAKIEFYDPRSTDLSAVVKTFVTTDGHGGSVAAPVFDAVMIPDEGQRLRSVASLLTYNGVDPLQVRFLGTLLWDDPKLGEEPSLQGGWYPAPPSASHQKFEARYAEAFPALPGRVASIVGITYDATSVAAELARRGDYSVGALTRGEGFNGIGGMVRLAPDGTSERGMAVREVSREGAREVSPAPSSFGAGY